MDIVPGAQLGQYRIVEQVGRGGMATVYKAFQPALNRQVAIKVLPAFYAEDPTFLERFRQEAQTVSQLRHPNILSVFDFGEQSGVTFMVSEFLPGGTLARLLGAPLPVSRAIDLLRPVAAALDYAHGRGTVHRDVKPSNVMLTDEGVPVLTDFGLARIVAGATRLTASGVAVGTPEYMAPEQAAAEAPTTASDRYALGVVLYEMLTGRTPFQAETPVAVALAHMHKPLPPPRSLNPALSEAVEQVLFKALAKNPADRFESCRLLVEALEAADRRPAEVGNQATAVLMEVETGPAAAAAEAGTGAAGGWATVSTGSPAAQAAPGPPAGVSAGEVPGSSAAAAGPAGSVTGPAGSWAPPADVPTWGFRTGSARSAASAIAWLSQHGLALEAWPGRLFARLVRATVVDAGVFREVAADSRLVGESWQVMVLLVILSSIGYLYVPLWRVAAPTLSYVVAMMLVQAVAWVVRIWLVQLALDRWAGKPVGFNALFRALTYAQAPIGLTVVPIVGQLGSLWALVTNTAAIRDLSGCTNTQAGILAVCGYVGAVVLAALVRPIL